MSDQIALANTFLTRIGWADAHRTVVAGDASNRRYERLIKSGDSAILMDAPPEKGEDVRPFMRIATHLTDQGLSAPRIYKADRDKGFLLIEDLGDDLFARLIAKDPALEAPLYKAAVDVLVHLHGRPSLDLPLCDADWLTQMTAPAFDWYAPQDTKTATQQFAEVFHPLAQQLDTVEKVTILRDFHAENLLWLPARQGVAQVGLLDFQDALRGHPAYDLVSILQDARRDVDPLIEAQMIARYLSDTRADAPTFRFAYALLGAQRNLRILGIFARLCLQDGKAQYVDLIPRVWAHLLRNLADPALAELAQLVAATLPAPTPSFLKDLKSRCKTAP